MDVYLIEESAGGPVLGRMHRRSSRPDDLNLISGAAAQYWDIRQAGFRRHQRMGHGVIRWTRADAEVTVPRLERAPSALRLRIARAVEPAARLTVTANGCTVYDGVVPHEEWETTLPLAPCRLAGDQLTIKLVTRVPPRSGRTAVASPRCSHTIPAPAERGPDRWNGHALRPKQRTSAGRVHHPYFAHSNASRACVRACSERQALHDHDRFVRPRRYRTWWQRPLVRLPALFGGTERAAPFDSHAVAPLPRHPGSPASPASGSPWAPGLQSATRAEPRAPSSSGRRRPDRGRRQTSRAPSAAPVRRGPSTGPPIAASGVRSSPAVSMLKTLAAFAAVRSVVRPIAVTGTPPSAIRAETVTASGAWTSILYVFAWLSSPAPLAPSVTILARRERAASSDRVISMRAPSDERSITRGDSGASSLA